jgi:serine palmitoyltransferase
LYADFIVPPIYQQLGFIVYGHRDSPIVPLLVFSPGKMGSFSRLMLEKYNIVTVVVAYPATPLVSSRVRFCVSAAHTKEDIDRVLVACDVVGDVLGLKLSSQHKRMKVDDIIKNARMLVEAGDS